MQPAYRLPDGRVERRFNHSSLSKYGQKSSLKSNLKKGFPKNFVTPINNTISTQFIHAIYKTKQEGKKN